MELVSYLRSELLSRLDRRRHYSRRGLEKPQGEEACQRSGAEYKRRLSSREVIHGAKNIFCRLVFQLCGRLVETVSSKMSELAYLGALLVKFACRRMERIGDCSNHRSASPHLLVHDLADVIAKAGDRFGSGSFELIGSL
jgi:hypothetical protein